VRFDRQEVEKWYRRLDQMVDACSTDDLGNIRNAFREEKIVLIEGGGWTTGSGVFLSSDEEDVPGAAVVCVNYLCGARLVSLNARPLTS
jgi:hypothetical protein